MTPAFLSCDDVLEIHKDLIRAFGGSEGVRDMGLLQSAVAVPQAGFGGQYFHTDLLEMAASYLFHLAKNHPFIDGNKRVGATAALVFLEINGIWIEATNEAIVETTLAVAEGKASKSAVAEFLRKHAAG